ncbi:MULTISPECIES: peptide chain release factor 1 [unclassified Porphyromonas]|uniref:peptide chain release factor 1 n=1 Tax=unclassified Porphyromonas TaxID=2645799 RepID=UPI00052C255B|nr:MULTISPECIES: peptide chain release factor 1 [unclassified Porphyromonas]KGN70403.1 peptide chain release factor 1 [Porphyromonas sp. COT-108 OH1349]KGN95500.1 peptide chain release factor 1 [Porphyromonas sp. COT-108 OH2963]
MAEQISIVDKISVLHARFEEVSLLITDPDVIADRKRFEKLTREYKELERILAKGDEYTLAVKTIEEGREMLQTESDPDMVALIKEEIATAQDALPVLEDEIKLLLVPADPEDAKDAIVEIRAGTGGDEAALFAADLYKMYVKYCESKGWRTEVTGMNEGTLGGFKEIVFTVTGADVYGTLKYESGVHRVQRVPQTETQGRVHTSAATVAVLPEADEFDVEVKESDIRIDTFCSSGAGGQSVNTTYSAVRLVHIPTGIVVQSQDERSQLKNKAKALAELRTRIYNLEHQKYLDEIAGKRKTMVSTGDRSAKIRTYNYPQGRITDHRINLTMYNLSAFMGGEIQEMLDALIVAENTERLKEAEL